MRVVLREVGTALFFFGVLAQEPTLQVEGQSALRALRSNGYQFSPDPIRIYPADRESRFGVHQAGGWRPGVITLRPNPLGEFTAGVYLRHELFHEASHRTCRGKMPKWAEEAGAMAFSGEVQGLAADQVETIDGKTAALERLAKVVRVDGELDATARRTLKALVREEGWPDAACQLNAKVLRRLQQPFGSDALTDSGLEYVLINLQSARVLESQGDLARLAPPGSLLKLPYVAALRSATEVGEELLRSDTSALLKRFAEFDCAKWNVLLSATGRASSNTRCTGDGALSPANAGSLLGERSAEGLFPIELSLRELALVSRAAFLSEQSRFMALAKQGTFPGATLSQSPTVTKKTLIALEALAKTGSVSNSASTPLMGHLLVIWPSSQPTFLAVFKRAGVNGAVVAEAATEILKEWKLRYTSRAGSVRVRLMSRLSREQWTWSAACPQFSSLLPYEATIQSSVCGEFTLTTSAFKAKPERIVRGLLEQHPTGEVVLLTDVESYADGVVLAEADALRGAAAEAFRAVVVWNATRGTTPHASTRSLCDLTHCMVFQGTPPGTAPTRGVQTDEELLAELDRIAEHHRLSWLPFSTGGSEIWEEQRSAAQLFQLLGGEHVIEIRRFRDRSGAVFIQLSYEEQEETVTCELFQTKVKLPSCPESVSRDEQAWTFKGVGQGHGQGLSIVRAAELQRRAQSSIEILRDAFSSESFRAEK